MKPSELTEDGGTSRHFFAVADRAHLRIYQRQMEPGQTTPGLRLVEAMDLPGGRGKIGDRLTDEAGRFPSGNGGPGGGIDERLPMQREGERRLAEEMGRLLSEFFRDLKGATWDLAVAKPLFNSVVAALEAGPRARLRRAIAKDLSNQPVEELRGHFARAEFLGAPA